MKIHYLRAAAVLGVVLCLSGNIWAYSGGNGTANNPYQIADANDLLELASNVAHYGRFFILMADIDLSGKTYTSAVIAPDTDNTPWNYFQGTKFTGNFDGNGHIISNLTIVAPDQDYVGLFGYVYYRQIRDLGVENVTVTGRNYVGGLAGQSESETLTACYTTGSVNGVCFAGGLVGKNYGGTHTSCYTTSTVNGTGDSSGVGGLMGENYGGTLISCYASGTVSKTGQTNDAGGLVGMNNYGSLKFCYATGAVYGSGYYTGGLVGRTYTCSLTGCYATGSVNGSCYYNGGLVGENNNGSLIRCYATGSVSGANFNGGLVGMNRDGGIITSCYAAGTVGLTYQAGGLVGTTYNTSVVTSSFWDTQTSGQSSSAGGTGKTTEKMQTLATFTSAGWDFSTADGDPADWRMPGDDYPQLAWEPLANPDSWPWQMVSNMLTARDQFAGCVIGDKIYVFGGNGNPDGYNLNSGEVYDIGTASWSPIASNTNEGIEELSGVGLNGKFYIFGGWGCFGGGGSCSVVNFNEMYDPATDTWTTLAQKPTTAAAAVPAVYNGQVYFFGGFYKDPNDGPEIHSTVVESYNPATDEWRYVTDMPKLLMSPAVAVLDDAAYIIGGFDPDANEMSTEVMVYHFTNNTWTRDYCTASAEAARAYSFASVTPVVDGKAYLIGGVEGTYTNSWSSDKFTLFDIAAQTWESGPVLPQPRCGHLVVMHEETPYVIGGYADDNDINRAKNSVYALLPAAVDLDGVYWFGSLSVDVDTNIPWGKRGTIVISGSTWSQEWDDYNGHHTFSSGFMASLQPDGSVNVIFPSQIYNIAWNGDVMLHANNDPDSENRLGIDLIIRKAVGVQSSDISGDYSNFGHWLGWNDRWDQAGWGDLAFNSDGTAAWNMTYDNGDFETGMLDWSLDAAEPMINVVGGNPALLCEGGLLFVTDPVPDNGDDFGLNFFVRKTQESFTMADMVGHYQTRFLESGLGGVPYTCGQGTCDIYALDEPNGILLLDAYFSDGEHEVSSIPCSVGPGNAFRIGDNNMDEGIVSPDKNLIFFPEYKYQDPPWRDDYDWLGGIFLIRVPESRPPSQPNMADLNGDGMVDLEDLEILCSHWLEESPDNGMWTWVSGLRDPNQPGVYGTPGVPDPNNVPGPRSKAVSWTDADGNFWLFGGWDGSMSSSLFNDLWKYDVAADLWTWMSGSSIPNQPGVYGTRGIPSPANTPGAREGSFSWTDANGVFWLFGGVGYDGIGIMNYLSDLWKYDPATGLWTWVGGESRPSTIGYYGGYYGTKGVAAPGNWPGGREGGLTWADSSGNLWLFGGVGWYSTSFGDLNDLWKYEPSSGLWTWVSGSNLGNQFGVYGTKGTASPENVPGGRRYSVSWKDNSGNFWLFGGHGYAASGGWVVMNDLWKFDGVNWTWMSGSSLGNDPGSYGIKGFPLPSTVPYAMRSGFSWADNSGNFWLFGSKNDLWKYDLSTGLWAWMTGVQSNQMSPAASYGTKGVASPDVWPGGRVWGLSWADSSGNLWLFGGEDGYTNQFYEMNDLWRYNNGSLTGDLNGDGIVDMEDFAILARNWLEDNSAIAEHIFEIAISTAWDYTEPGVSTDDMYEFEVEILTDGTVDRVEFATPAGNTFEIPNTPSAEFSIPGGWMEIGREFQPQSGWYEWYYGPSFSNPDSLLDYGDGLYTFTITYTNGRTQQTTAWFGIPGTADPITQPTQEPVFTSFYHRDTLTSPVSFTWDACVDPAASMVWMGLENYNTGEESEYFLAADATGLSDPLTLDEGTWEAELGFEVWYSGPNSDGIAVYAGKYSESDTLFTVSNCTTNIADHVFEIEIETAWDHESPDDTGDDTFDFELDLLTDDTVIGIEFTTPAGFTFTIPYDSYVDESPQPDGLLTIGREYDWDTGWYEWTYEYEFYSMTSLADYGDGLYTLTVYYSDGCSQQTTAWFGIPGTPDPVPQPTQMPVFTGFDNGDIVCSPVSFTWEPCIEPAVQQIVLEYEGQWPNYGEHVLAQDATSLGGPVTLAADVYEIYLAFEVLYESQNSDAIFVRSVKYSESDYGITVLPTCMADLNSDGYVDYDDWVILASQWMQTPGIPSADIAPMPAGDGVVNLDDLALFVQHWLEGAQ